MLQKESCGRARARSWCLERWGREQLSLRLGDCCCCGRVWEERWDGSWRLSDERAPSAADAWAAAGGASGDTARHWFVRGQAEPCAAELALLAYVMAMMLRERGMTVARKPRPTLRAQPALRRKQSCPASNRPSAGTSPSACCSPSSSLLRPPPAFFAGNRTPAAPARPVLRSSAAMS